MPDQKIIIGSRGSALALWQSNHVKAELERAHPGLSIEIKIIKTTGDKILTSSLAQIGGKGVFTKELEDALLASEIDLAVHSLKDLPTMLPDGLGVCAILKRASVEDAFLSNNRSLAITDLPQGATVATGSLRRKAQLLAIRPDLSIADIRGNVPTRVEKLRASTWNGMILASAGLERLGMAQEINHKIDAMTMLPAPGQGAIAIESRTEDSRTKDICAVLHDKDTEDAVTAEREVLRMLGGGCQVPLGTYGLRKDGVFEVHAAMAKTDGKNLIRVSKRAEANETPIEVAQKTATYLLERGGAEIISALRNETPFSSLISSM
jgi:hydroxymethylbilane synthase